MLDLRPLRRSPRKDWSLARQLLPPDVRLTVCRSSVGCQERPAFRGGQAVQAILSAHEGLAAFMRPSEFLGVGELADDGQVAPRRVFLIREKTP